MSRVTQDTAMLHFASHTGLSPSMVTFSKVFCSRFAYNVAVLQPRWRLATSTVWAVPRSLATTCGITVVFSSSSYLDVSVQRVRSSSEVPLLVGCPIRTSADQGLFAPPRSFSQLITSFVALQSLGILRMPFFRFLCSLKSHPSLERDTPLRFAS